MTKTLAKGFVLATLMSLMFVSTAYAGTVQAIGGNSTMDQDLINAAIAQAQAGDVIRLSGNYVISGPINMRSGISLLGDGTATITAIPERFSSSGAGMIIMKDVTNVEIGNFEINGGETSTASQYKNGGHGWQSGIVVTGSSANCTIHDIYFTRLDGDGVRATGDTSYITVEDCTMNTTGHDGVQAWGGNYWLVKNCKMNLFINSGVRYANTVNSVIQNCEFYCNTGSGFCGVELEDDVSGDVIQNCNFHDIKNSYNLGIATVHAKGSISLYNNTFTNCRDMSIQGIMVTNATSNSSITSGSRITQSECCAVWNVSQDKYTKMVTPYGALVSLVCGYSNQGVKNAALANTMMKESAADVKNAAIYANTTGGQTLASRLIEESIIKQEYAEKLMKLGTEDLGSARDLVNVTISQSNITENTEIDDIGIGEDQPVNTSTDIENASFVVNDTNVAL